MTIYNFADILLVPFPFTDFSTSKKRPAVVVSSEKYNRQKSDVIIMAITSQLQSPSGFGEIMISDYAKAGLLKPSMIKPVITTIEKSLIIRKLGRLNSSDCQALQQLLQLIMG